MNWQGRILSWIIAAIFFMIIALHYSHKEGWLKLNSYNKTYIKRGLIVGLPLIPHVIGKFVINKSDVIFIQKMISIEGVCIYKIGYQFGFIISIISGAFLSVYTHFLYER